MLHKDYDHKCTVEKKERKFMAVSPKGLGAKAN
jgi:hypothetical protein